MSLFVNSLLEYNIIFVNEKLVESNFLLVTNLIVCYFSMLSKALAN